MKDLSRILVIVDADMHAAAELQRAQQLAQRAHADVYLLMCAYDAMLDSTLEIANPRVQEMARAHYIEIRRRWLEARAAELARAGVRTRCEVLWTHQPHEAVLARTLVLAPDLVVHALPPRRPGSEEAKPRGFDWRLARSCPAPLLLTRPVASASPQRVAAAIDILLGGEDRDHPLNHHVADCAARLAALLQTQAGIAYVFPYARPTSAVGLSVDLRTLYDEARLNASASFTRFNDRHAIAADGRYWIEGEGDPAAALPAFVAREHVDLLVLGSTYRSALGRLVLGSVSEDLVRELPCDIVLVKPQDFVDELARHHDLDELRRRYGPPVAEAPAPAAAATQNEPAHDTAAVAAGTQEH